MDGVFTPIFVILMISLLLECVSLLLGDFGMALCSRLIILLLFYLGHVIKRDVTLRTVRNRHHKLLHFHNYVLFCISLASLFFHLIMLLLVPFRLYCTVVLLTTLPVAVDEYHEIQWLQSVQTLFKEERNSLYHDANESDSEEVECVLTSVEIRPSIFYYAWSKTLQLLKFITDDKREGIV